MGGQPASAGDGQRISLAAGAAGSSTHLNPYWIMSAKPRKAAVTRAAVTKLDEKKEAKAAETMALSNAGEGGQKAVGQSGVERSAFPPGWDSAPCGSAGNEPKSVLEALGLAHLNGVGEPSLPFDPVKFRSIGPMATSAASSATVRAALAGAGMLPAAKHIGRAGQIRINYKLATRALLNEKCQAAENNYGERRLAKADIEKLTTQHEGKLKFILRLLNEPSFNPRQSRDPDLDWSTISVVLASMPHRFRNDALRMMVLGTNKFGKVPFTFNNPDNAAEGSRVTGPPRPMGCPEAAQEGSDFALAWMIGGWWDWRLPGGRSVGDGVSALIDDRAGGDLDGMLLALSACRSAEHWHWSERAEAILDLLGAGPYEKLIHHHDIFRAGVNFAALVLFGNERPVGYHTADQATNQWAEIFHHALIRHGERMKPAKLLEALDPIAWGKMPEKPTDGTGGIHAIPEFAWGFVPDEKASFDALTKKISDTKALLSNAVTFERLMAKEMSRLKMRLHRKTLHEIRVKSQTEKGR